MKMKEKGFTLVELLTVFVILSIILGMVVVNVNNYSSKQREKDYENLVKIIEENAKVLVNKNEDLFVGVTNYASSKVIDVNGNTLNGCKFSYDLLVDNKLMDKDTVNPVDNKAFYDNNYSIIATLSDKGTYNYELKQNVNDDYTNCRDIDNISIENMNLSLTSTSNSVTAKVTVSNTLDFVRRVDWVLYDEEDNKLKEVSSENLIYNFGGLKSNKLYKVRAKLVSVTNKYQEKIDKANTLPILNPYITITNNPTTLQNGYLYSQNISITYNGGGVTSPTYYLKSTKNGNIDSSLNISCGTGSMPSNCTETQSTTILSENMWYKVPKNISISYNNENDKIGTIYAVTFDGNNYSSSITATLDKIDRTPPSCSWSGESTSWTKENRTITATCNDSKSGCTKDTSSKAWSYTSGTTKQKSLSYTIKDNVGNTATCSKEANIYVDKDAPTCSWSGESTTWTSSNRTITATCNDSGSGCIKDTASKSWSYTSGTTKQKNLSYTIKDNVGNTVTCSKIANIYVDKDAPTCTSSGGSNAWTNDSRTLVGTCSDSGSGCKGNVSWLINWEGNWENLSPGRVYDNVDNYVDCPANQIVKIDKTPPTCTSSGGSDAWTKDSRTLVGTCSDSESGCKGNVSWYINGEGNWTDLSPGTVYDNAGNPTVCPKNQIVRIDRTTPTSSIAMTNYSSWGGSYSVTSDSYVNGIATFVFSTSSSASGKSSVKYCISKSECTPDKYPSMGNNSILTNQGDGTYNIYYKAISPTGVESSINKFVYKLDRVAPNVWCETNGYGYYVAKCLDNDGGSGCINDMSDSSIYERFGPLTSAFTIKSSDAKESLFENKKAYPGQNLENGGLLLNSSGDVRYRNTNTFYPLKMYTSYMDRAGNSSNCECDVPKRQG